MVTSSANKTSVFIDNNQKPLLPSTSWKSFLKAPPKGGPNQSQLNSRLSAPPLFFHLSLNLWEGDSHTGCFSGTWAVTPGW